MAVTHQDIAEKMGVSRALVTKALHGSGGTRVSEDTRREVLRVANQMGYTPRGLTTHNVGYLLSVEHLRLEAATNFLINSQRVLHNKGYRLTLADTDGTEAGDLRQVLNSKSVDGVICTLWQDGKVRRALPKALPHVLVSDEDGVGHDVDVIAMDAFVSTQRVFEYLLGLKHRRFALIIGATDIKYHREIKRGAHATLTQAGLAPDELELVEVLTNKQIGTSLAALLSTHRGPTAVVVANPGQAVPALHAIISAGLQVPRDISLVSLVDSPQFAALSPEITSTDAMGEALAERAVLRLLEKIRDPQSAPTRVLVAGEIIERESVAPAALRLNNK